jgi:hypothetical protein
LSITLGRIDHLGSFWKTLDRFSPGLKRAAASALDDHSGMENEGVDGKVRLGDMRKQNRVVGIEMNQDYPDLADCGAVDNFPEFTAILPQGAVICCAYAAIRPFFFRKFYF